jgi:predicted ATPase
LVGREHDVHRVAAALREAPLVTLTGVGGVGKTRLALEAASRRQQRFADGVWMSELAPLDDSKAMSHAIAATLRLQQQQGLGIEETVIEYLRTRELLLVVDNCEHVLDAASGLIERIVAHCPRVSVPASSREALGIAGERILPVPPLPVEDAIALFADRARPSRPDFDLDHEPVGAVAEICRRLDGLPLAIELAAARMRVMSSLDVARRLDRLRLLSGGARSASPRQQSLTATIDWCSAAGATSKRHTACVLRMGRPRTTRSSCSSARRQVDGGRAQRARPHPIQRGGNAARLRP